AANAALVNFTKGLADLGAECGVLVTAVSPAATRTERWDQLMEQQAKAAGKTVDEIRAASQAPYKLGRIATPEDIADDVCFLASAEDLRERFAQAGTVETVRIITDQFTGRPRGFGFVEMATKEEATKAVEMLNGRLFRDRNLVVDEARPQPQRGAGGGGGPRGDRGGRPGGGGGGWRRRRAS